MSSTVEYSKFVKSEVTILTNGIYSFVLTGPGWDTGVILVALDDDHANLIIRAVERTYLSGMVDGMDKILPKWKETLDSLAKGFSNGPDALSL